MGHYAGSDRYGHDLLPSEKKCLHRHTNRRPHHEALRGCRRQSNDSQLQPANAGNEFLDVLLDYEPSRDNGRQFVGEYIWANIRCRWRQYLRYRHHLMDLCHASGRGVYGRRLERLGSVLLWRGLSIRGRFGLDADDAPGAQYDADQWAQSLHGGPEQYTRQLR